MATKDRPNGYWTDVRIQEEALKYNSKNKFRKGSPSAYIIAHRKGIAFFDKICSHMPKRIILRKEDKPNFKWTLEKLIEEARKYLTREDFKRGNLGAYGVAVRRDDYDLICAHMPLPINEAYTDEELLIITAKYSSIRDFAKDYPGAYGSIKNRGRLRDFCSHMKRASGSSIPEKDIFSEITKFFQNTKKIRHTKISIPNKSYITAFEIDIFVPELNKGIEFDGRRYHNFDYMRRDKSKRLWPDEDIRNYHQIKDEYFVSKGIQILHIKEEDWKNNKVDCIFQIEQFLGITGFMPEFNQKVA